MTRPLTLGSIVKTWRTAEPRKWTTAELAKAVGTSRQNIENLEAGAVGNPRYLQALARVMGYASIDDLLDLKPPPGTPVARPPAVEPPHEPWLFELIRWKRVDVLTPTERGVVESAMLTALERIEELRRDRRIAQVPITEERRGRAIRMDSSQLSGQLPGRRKRHKKAS